MQDLARARAALARYDSAEIGAQVDVAAARSNLAAAESDRDRARVDLDRAIVRAPSDGSVLTLYARAGERPSGDGLMTFGDLRDMTAEIEVYENEVAGLRPGAPVRLLAFALPRKLSGRLARVGAEVLRQTLTDASPAANTDTRVVRVTVDLDTDSASVAARFPNLKVTAQFGPARYDHGRADPVAGQAAHRLAATGA